MGVVGSYARAAVRCFLAAPSFTVIGSAHAEWTPEPETEPRVFLRHLCVTLHDRRTNTFAERGLTCTYVRECQKRGKVSRRDLAQQQASAAVTKDNQPSEGSTAGTLQSQDKAIGSFTNSGQTLPEGQWPLSVLPCRSAGVGMASKTEPTPPHPMMSSQFAHVQAPQNHISPDMGLTNMDSIPHSPGSNSQDRTLPFPSSTLDSDLQQPNLPQRLPYPILEPLVPHLVDIMSVSLACHLLESYFRSSSTLFVQPKFLTILNCVFRKTTFLRLHSPRVSSPALLASMLWIGCWVSDSPDLPSSASARRQLSEKLINLTLKFLKPLVSQRPADMDTGSTMYTNSGHVNGATIGDSGMPAHDSEIWTRKFSSCSTFSTGAI
jgi:hypothetical protein